MSVAVQVRRSRHVAVRTCAGCGRRAPKAELRRFGLAVEGGLEWRHAGGRGSYLHYSGDCARQFALRKKIVPGLRTRIARDAREALVATTEIS